MWKPTQYNAVKNTLRKISPKIGEMFIYDEGKNVETYPI